MASLKCSKCGFGIHYHDEPNGVELTAIPLSTWDLFSFTNKPIVRYNLDGPQDYLIIWKCPNCGCLHKFMASSTRLERAYELCSEETFDTCGTKYILFDDYDFDDISEKGLTASEYEKLRDSYKAKLIIVNDDYILIYNDIKYNNVEEVYKSIHNE
ncbi:MAG: hypothetical protein ACI4M3_03575 [Acutalibacteraceae bacterium]